MDSEELQALINEYYPQIRRAALALCGDPWEADEIAQETFMAALKSIASLRDASAKGTWLYGVCLRIHRSRLRSAMRHMKRISLTLMLSRASAPDRATRVGLITPVRVREVPLWQLEPRFQDAIQKASAEAGFQKAWTEAGFQPSLQL